MLLLPKPFRCHGPTQLCCGRGSPRWRQTIRPLGETGDSSPHELRLLTLNCFSHKQHIIHNFLFHWNPHPSHCSYNLHVWSEHNKEYFGEILTSDGRCVTQIKSRIGDGKKIHFRRGRVCFVQVTFAECQGKKMYWNVMLKMSNCMAASLECKKAN